jgi:hypothetical protein
MTSFTDRMIGAARLDPQIYEEVEADQTAMGQAMGVVVLAGVAAGIGAARGGLGSAILGALAALIGWFIWAGLTYLIGAKVMPEPQTQADLGQLLRTIGFSAAPGILKVLGILPLFGGLIVLLASVWQLVAMVIAVQRALDYTSVGRAVVVCLIGFIVYMVVTLTIIALFVGAAFVGGAVAS